MLNRVLLAILGVLLLVIESTAFAEDVYVPGYTKEDGTYVRPHIRSSPNENKWDNYGPSQNDSELLNPRARNTDNDSVPNYLDRDDDNDGLADDNDPNQYGEAFDREALGGTLEEAEEE